MTHMPTGVLCTPTLGGHYGVGAGLGGMTPGLSDSSFFVILGQSNEIGEVDYSGTVAGESFVYSQDPTESFDASFAGCTFTQYYSQTRSPLAFVTLATGSLRPYDVAGQLNLGPSQSFGRLLAQYLTAHTPDLLTVAVSGSYIDDWLPGSSAGNLETAYAQIDARIAATGKTIGGIFFGQGEADATDATLAANWGTKMTTIAAALRARYGATIPIVIKRLASTLSATYLSTMRSTQTTWVATDALSKMINTDDFQDPGGLHYNSRDHQTYGERAAAVLLNMGSTPIAAGVSSVPVFIGAGPAVTKYNSTTTIIRGRGDAIANDIEILITYGSRGNYAVTTPTTPAGFTLITGASVSSASGADYVFLAAYWRRVDQTTLDANLHSMPSVTLNDTNFNNMGRIFLFRNCIASGNPYDVVQTSANNTYGTALSITGATTTVNNTMVCLFSGGNYNSTSSPLLPSVTNADLTSLTLQKASRGDYNGGDTANNRQLINFATGIKATAGTFTATTGTMPLATLMANIAVALKGA